MSRLAIDGGDPIRTAPFPPWPFFYDDEKQAVQEVLDSGKVNYWTGSLGMAFQDRFAEYCGAGYGIAVSNGTAALHVAMAAANIGPGDEVIVPARTFIASASAVLNQNAIPVFADVDLQSHTISPESVASLINTRTRGVIAVHLAGHPAEMDPLMELAKEHDLVVIEDAAQAHGAEYRGRRAGSLGHMAAFSFCQDKIFTTGGEGGMVTTSDEAMAGAARTLKDHGYWEEERRSLLEMEQLYTYIHHRMGYNYRMTEMQAAIGLKALEKLDWNVETRRRNAHYLTKQLSELDYLRPAFEAPHVRHSFYKYYCTLDLERIRVERDAFVKAVRAEGVPIAIGSSAELYREKVFQEQVGFGDTGYPFKDPTYEGEVDYSKVFCPNASRIGDSAFVLQVHPTIELGDLDDVVAAIRKVGESYRA